MTDTGFFRQLLEQRRSVLMENGAVGDSASGVVELDQTRQGRLSRMDAMQQQAMAVESQRRRKTDLKRIDAALARINAGTYGRCLDCDEDIAEGRLRVDPAATRCIRCAETAG